MRSLEVCREAWRDQQELSYRAADEALNGNLVSPSRRDEFRQLFGFTGYAIRRALFLSPGPVRRRYASEELVNWWNAHPHVTFEQWAWQSGFRHQFLRAGRARWAR